jgi:hypothetical protein
MYPLKYVIGQVGMVKPTSQPSATKCPYKEE